MSAIIRPIEGLDSAAKFGRAYRTVWRWHFYAGLFCLPFILVLSISGAVYLFKPQIDIYLDRQFDHLTLSGAPRALDEQVAAALTANPGARLEALQFRDDPADAARVLLVTPEGRELRVLVRPDTLEILETGDERSRFSNFMGELHGSLLMGEAGAVAVELAGAWAIVMVVTGLYLWWPRGRGLAGILYPRLAGGRVFLRDLHAVTGFWLSILALFFLISALPWTKVWGESLKFVRSIGQMGIVKQDWTTGPASAQAQRLEAFGNAPPAMGEHAGHAGHAPGGVEPGRLTGFDELATRIAPLALAEPVFIKPPSATAPNWIVVSFAQNRPLRETLEFDPKSLEKVRHERFEDLLLTDRIIKIGIAAHEGQLFGWFNQLLGLVTAIGYLALVITSTLMWWRRRPHGTLGAPPALAQAPRLAAVVVSLVVALGIFLPTLGVSLVLVLMVESAIRRFAPGASRWLGLAVTRRATT